MYVYIGRILREAMLLSYVHVYIYIYTHFGSAGLLHHSFIFLGLMLVVIVTRFMIHVVWIPNKRSLRPKTVRVCYGTLFKSTAFDCTNMLFLQGHTSHSVDCVYLQQLDELLISSSAIVCRASPPACAEGQLWRRPPDARDARCQVGSCRWYSHVIFAYFAS